MPDWNDRWRDYCERFAAALGVPFTFDGSLALQVVCDAQGRKILLSPYLAFGERNPVADAEKLSATA